MGWSYQQENDSGMVHGRFLELTWLAGTSCFLKCVFQSKWWATLKLFEGWAMETLLVVFCCPYPRHPVIPIDIRKNKQTATTSRKSMFINSFLPTLVFVCTRGTWFIFSWWMDDVQTETSMGSEFFNFHRTADLLQNFIYAFEFVDRYVNGIWYQYEYVYAYMCIFFYIDTFMFFLIPVTCKYILYVMYIIFNLHIRYIVIYIYTYISNCP